MTRHVTIIDYGHGNANSIKNALSELGVSSRYSSEPADIEDADWLILPGVGHFASAVASLKERNLLQPLTHAALQLKKPVLGICLGMQLMTASSEEGGSAGLEWVQARTTRIRPSDRIRFKVPHVGWNTIEKNPSCRLLAGIDTAEEPFYFCHSYAIESVDDSVVAARMEYDKYYVGVFEAGNLFGVQFHPEKSQESGLKLLRNFLSVGG